MPGCNIGINNCYEPFAICNDKLGYCVPITGICEGACVPSSLFYLLLAAIFLSIIISCTICCVFRARRDYYPIKNDATSLR